MKMLRILAPVLLIGVMGMITPKTRAAQQTVPDGPRFSVVWSDKMQHLVPKDSRRVCKGDTLKISAVGHWQLTLGNGSTMMVPMTGEQVTVTGTALSDIISLKTTQMYRYYSRPGLIGGAAVAEFTYRADTVGRQLFTFTANVPTYQFSPETTVVTEALGVTVEECKVKVNMIYEGYFPVSPATFYFNGLMDEIKVEPDENGHLHGEGQMVAFTHAIGLVGCSAAWSTVLEPVTISGEARDERLNLEFAFGTGQGMAETNCPLGLGRTGGFEIAPLFNRPLSFPMEGGVATYPFPVSPPYGTVRVTVTRDEDEQAVADAGALLLGALVGSP